MDMENNTYSKANKVCDETKDKSTEYTKRLGFKIKEKEKKHYQSCTGFLKRIRSNRGTFPNSI